MKRMLLSMRVGLVVAPLAMAQAQPTPLYENFGVITAPPQIDALAFANYGSFSVFTLLPFDFQNTLNFTNTGTIFGSPGFLFDTASSSQPRRMAASFFNRAGASVTASDAQLGVSIVNGVPVDTQLIFPSYLLLSATNLVNKGVLTVGAGGRLNLQAKKMDLSRGGLNVQPIAGIGDVPVVFTNYYVPEVGIDDNYWGGPTNDVMNSAAIVVPGGVISPPHSVTNIFGFGQVQLALANPFAFTFTNRITATNWLIQAAFVAPAPSIGVRALFAPSQILTNPYRSVVVELSLVDTNVATGNLDVQALYFTDRLASDTNYIVLQNFIANPFTYRPGIYELSRLPFNFFGSSGNALFDPEFIYNPGYSNTIVTNFYAGYSALVDYRPIPLPVVEGLSITNQPGRIEIQADELNMERTRIRGNSFVLVSTKHLIGSSDAVVDSPHLSFNLASTNGTLRVQNLARDSVVRPSGPIYAWSGIWTNYTGMLVTNTAPDPMDPTMTITNVATNVVEIGIHVLMLDASALQTIAPVVTHDYQNHSTNIFLNDRIQVVDSFLLDGESFTLNGRLQLSSTVAYWTAANAPTLQYLTNNGTLIIDNAATFGNDRSNAYSAIVNNGTMSGPSYSFRSGYFENSGSITANARLTLEAAVIKFQGGGSVSGNDVTFAAGDAKFLGATITTSGEFHLVVTNSLEDAGAISANSWSCQQGFNMHVKPRFGDLLGTTVSTVPQPFAVAPHFWAGEDRGPTIEGFKDNAAIGRLVLDGSLQSFLQFDAASPAGNALYVDFLDLQGLVLNAFNLGELEFILGLGPNFVIYFADASVPVDELDGLLGGQLRWVKDFTGPNSSVDVLLLNGQTVKMNRALRDSLSIDSDGDGVANGQDAYPLDAAVWTSVALTTVSGNKVPLISWNAQPFSAYVLEYTTSLTQPDWKPLKTLTNDALTPGSLSMVDTNGLVGATQRFYRIRYQMR